MKLTQKLLRSMLFLDIETVPRYESYEKLDESWKALWNIKHNTFKDQSLSPAQTYEERAGIYAEFGKVICVSTGFFALDKTANKDTFRVKSFWGEDENEILQALAELFREHFKDIDKWQISGHNVREFDIPFLCRRMLANGIHLPPILDLTGRKPWEINVVDTLQLWRFGDYKNYTSLRLIAATLGIPSPKDDIEGKDVSHVFWKLHDLARIKEYCQRDVITVARIVLQLKGESSILTDLDVVVL